MRDIVAKLIRQYETRDPFAIARQRQIIVIEEPLGSIRGYYSRSYRQPFIHINNGLTEPQRLFTCAHELGHAILHPKANTPFLRKNTLLSVNRYEQEANRFAVCLLIDDDQLREYGDCTIPQLARAFGISEQLVEYRLKAVRK